jgi:hypothetical protein
LKSSSQVSNVPLLQGAASEGAAAISSRALTAQARMEKRGIMVSFAPGRRFIDISIEITTNVWATAAKTRL